MAKTFEHRFSGHHALGGTRRTSAAMRAWFERLYRLNQKLDFEIRHIAVSGTPWNTTAVVEWRDTATLANGAPYVNQGAHVIGMRWGKVVTLHAYLDTAILAEALLGLAKPCRHRASSRCPV